MLWLMGLICLILIKLEKIHWDRFIEEDWGENLEIIIVKHIWELWGKIRNRLNYKILAMNITLKNLKFLEIMYVNKCLEDLSQI